MTHEAALDAPLSNGQVARPNSLKVWSIELPGLL